MANFVPIYRCGVFGRRNIINCDPAENYGVLMERLEVNLGIETATEVTISWDSSLQSLFSTLIAVTVSIFTMQHHHPPSCKQNAEQCYQVVGHLLTPPPPPWIHLSMIQ